MAIKRIISPFSGSETSIIGLEFALKLATEMKADVECLHISPDPKTMVYPYNELALYMPNDFENNISKSNRKHTSKAKELFAEIIARPQYKAVRSKSFFNHVIGTLDDVISDEGKLSDLIVLRNLGQNPTPEQKAILNSALFETGRPVIITPSVLPDGKLSEHIALAWNNSREATHALTNTLPLMYEAKKITLIAGTEEKEKNPYNIEGLKRYLEEHKLKPEVEILHTPANAGEDILKYCLRENVSLLVMGAFTQNRLKQFVMGGVTSFMLESTEIPICMSH